MGQLRGARICVPGHKEVRALGPVSSQPAEWPQKNVCTSLSSASHLLHEVNY